MLGTYHIWLPSDSCFGDGNVYRNLAHYCVSESYHIFGFSDPQWKKDIAFGIASSVSGLDNS